MPANTSAPAAAANDALSRAFEALQTYDHGSSRAALLPIDNAVVASLGDAPARPRLEQRLAAVLQSGAPAVAKEYVCAKLALIGSAESAAALAALLDEEQLSTAARTALEAMPGPAAALVLLGALPELKGIAKVGVIHSLGARRVAASVGAFAPLLADADPRVAAAAAAGLGAIGTPEAVRALLEFLPKAPEAVQPAVRDAGLVGAEHLLAAGHKAEALAIYKTLAASGQPKHVQLAATRGLLAAARSQ